MGTIQNGAFISGYEGQRIDFLLGQVENKVETITQQDVQGFVGDCVAAQTAAETASRTAQAYASDAQNSFLNAYEARNGAEHFAEVSGNAAGEALAYSEMADAAVTSAHMYADEAEYWAEQASHAAGGGVYSFNNRAGYVIPESGDYTAAMVGAVPVIGKGKQLLDNAYFIGGGSQQGGGQFPINQRGQTSYSGNGYAIDRWRMNYSPGVSFSTTVNNDCLSFAKTGNSVARFRQPIVGTFKAGTTFTLSMLAKIAYDDAHYRVSMRLSKGTALISGAYLKLTASNSYQLYTVTCTLPEDISDLWVELLWTDLAEFTADIQAAKLEYGDTQTLARNVGTAANPQWVLNDPVPNFATELMKCLRYCYALPKYMRVRAAIVYPDYIDFSIPLAIPLMVDTSKPVIIGDANIGVYGVTGGAVSGFTFELVNTNRASTYNTAPILILRARKTAHGLTDACLNVTEVGCLISSE